MTDRPCGGVRGPELQEHHPHAKGRQETLGQAGLRVSEEEERGMLMPPSRGNFVLQGQARHGGRGSGLAVIVTKWSVTKAKAQPHPRGHQTVTVPSSTQTCRHPGTLEGQGKVTFCRDWCQFLGRVGRTLAVDFSWQRQWQPVEAPHSHPWETMWQKSYGGHLRGKAPNQAVPPQVVQGAQTKSGRGPCSGTTRSP